MPTIPAITIYCPLLALCHTLLQFMNAKQIRKSKIILLRLLQGLKSNCHLFLVIFALGGENVEVKYQVNTILLANGQKCSKQRYCIYEKNSSNQNEQMLWHFTKNSHIYRQRQKEKTHLRYITATISH